jgi:hypothetical protein
MGLNHYLVNVTPAPIFAWLKGLDNGMLRRVKMLCCVFILRGIAAAHVSADKAEAQMDPGITCF